MHESVFSYGLSRPYPYRWFTWVVVVGGILAAALFSVINLAADGYELIVTVTSDPNRTIANSQSRWFEKWSLQNKISAQCQPQNIALGSQFYTNNTALAWTVSIIQSAQANSSNDWTRTTATAPSFAYLNNIFEDCEIASIYIYIGNNTSGASPTWSVNPYAQVDCNVSTGAGVTNLGLTASITSPEFTFEQTEGTYIQYPGPDMGLRNLWQTNNTNSFIWGLYFLAAFGTSLLLNDNDATQQIADAINGTVALCDIGLQLSGLTPNPSDFLIKASTPTGSSDIMDPTFFSYSQPLSSACGANTSSLALTGDTFAYIDGLSKAFYSMLLTDLGQVTTTNVLASPNLVMQFMELIYDGDEEVSGDPSTPSYVFQNETAFFDYFSGPGDSQVAGIPSVSPSVIAQQYFCQVPQLKSTGSLLIAILVADLVFLQALWKVLNWVVTFGLERRHPEAKYCVGCAKSLDMPHRGDQLGENKEASVNVSTAKARGESLSNDRSAEEEAQAANQIPAL